MRRQFDITQPMPTGQGGADLTQGADLTMTTPTRPAGFIADLAVPFGQAAITGALVSGLITFAAARTGFEGDVGALWVGLALLIGSASWIFLLVDTRRLLRTIERLSGLDIDGDGKIGNPQDRMVLVNAPAARKEAAQVAEEQEKAEVAAELSEFVAKLPTVGTDQRTWEPRIGREKYTTFRGVLLEMGWAEWNSPRDKRRGWSLVLPVREILRRISTE